ncbi:Protein of unknown function [Cognatiyoonia koreensis]|uniref:DUF2927 domain-containing protein n=1 Tax=Cognatiyoonia koreensis TaxID=364200 RepID=A0A1I0QE10_9RHOB|nr:DUF2927 domain-containing protein [Cognatiyoonia koreensis]SEW25066.1 Protein of unknown function [Cognatiyoonia koreensis]
MISGRKSLFTLSMLGLIALAACETPLVEQPPETPPEIPQVVPPEVPEIVEPSEASKALAIYYRRLQNDLLAQGLLRGDGGGPDTPFTDTILARNFVRIALFDEYVTDGDALRPQATLSRLRRWDQPVRMSVEFGASVPEMQRARDASGISAYIARLSRVTGLSIRKVDENPNFHVLILNEDDRLAYRDRIREIVPGIATSSLNAIINLPRDQLCIVVAFSEGGSSSYSKAIAVIRSEHPDLLRTSCIHEELAQGLGLANDSPQARPSIFNDDEEFGLLTTHDELLLKMLYDPRLRTGMQPAEAAPVARQIARELLDRGAS